MQEKPVKFLTCGDTALVVEFGDAIDRALSDKVLGLDARLRAASLPGVVESVPTFRSLMVHYDPLKTNAEALTAGTRALLAGELASDRVRRLWRIPVCYEGELAPDLADVAERTGLAVDRVVTLHAETRYHVYMIGFLPGYPYMGDLAPPLVLPRRSDPRTRVPPGSVSIATTMTAIYPVESPGGWHLIGTTPIRIFDLALSPPALLAPGDAVEFERIDRDAFLRIRAESERGRYRLQHQDLAA
ncbi:MAG TPA: 5-oxoprolinase subunit PxpB [Stellaceae bacterium]|nr:5-oxoprolinase subunit PxpB [Stellaceae bacterium]